MEKEDAGGLLLDIEEEYKRKKLQTDHTFIFCLNVIKLKKNYINYK